MTRVLLTVLLVAVGLLGGFTFVQDQRYVHQQHCMSVLESAVSQHTPASMRGALVDEYDRECS